jgi:uncharacterized protein (UPF0276 family)
MIAALSVAPAPLPIPARAGVGLKPQHYRDIAHGEPAVSWFEVHPENYMGDGGAPHHWLGRIRRDYPISMHGVGLSIGAARPLDTHHLKRLTALVERYQPGRFSEHLAWSTHDCGYLNDLLPLPYTAETLDLVSDHVDQIQTALHRTILIENPSTYVQFTSSEMSEVEFLRALANRTGCGLLLDVNNVHVSAVNHGFDAADYLESFPLERVGEIHLAGCFETADADGACLLIDAHDSPVRDAVWSLYRQAIVKAGPLPTLIEWDNDVPAWPSLVAEARKADIILAARNSCNAAA